MASLASCLKKFSKSIPRDDRSQLIAIRLKLQSEGLSGSDLDARTVDEFYNTLNEERDDVVQQLEDAGADVAGLRTPNQIEPIESIETVEPIETEPPFTIKEVEFDESLSPDKQAMAQRFAEKMASMPWSEAVAQYSALDGKSGPEDTKVGKANSVDSWRELSDDYAKDRTQSEAVHEVASALSKKHYRVMLERAVDPWMNNVIFTSGGTGAGKTSGLKLSDADESAELIFDSNAAKFGSAVNKIDQALDAGRLVTISHVIRHPIEALQNGAISRAMKQEIKWGHGRVVPLTSHVGTHVGSAKVIKRLAEHYTNDSRVRIEVIDNRYGKGGAVKASVASVADLDYDQLMEQGRVVLDQMYENNLVSKSIYEGFLAGAGAAAPNAGAVAGVQPEVTEDAGLDDQLDQQSSPAGIAPPGSKVETEQPLYVRSPESSTGPAPKQAEMRIALAPAIRSLVGKVQVNVAQSTAELPGDAIPGDVEGMWNTGTDEVWLVSDNIGSIDRAKRVMAHEVFGHLAMEQQPEFKDALAAVRNLKNMGNAAILSAADQVAKTQGNLDSVTESKEILAVMAENGIQSGTMNRVIAATRQMLRRVGLNLQFNEAELRELIARAARDVTTSAAQKQAVLANMPVQQQILNYPRSVDQAISNAVEEVYAEQTLQDYVVRAHAELNAISHNPSARADEIRGAMEDAANAEILYSRAISADPEIESLIASKMATPLEDVRVKDRYRGVVEKIKGIDFLSVKQGIIDSAASIRALEENRFGGLQDASESAYKAVLATKNLGSVMAAVMQRGVPVLRNGVFSPRADRKGFLQIFEPITSHKDGNLLPQWELYAAAKRSSRLINERNSDGTSREKLFTREEIAKALELETQYPEFKTAFLEWQAFNNQMLDLAIKQGVINGEEAKVWRQNDYVPFYLAMEEVEYKEGQGPRTGRGGVANVNNRIKRLSGSDAPLGNIFENMVMNTSYLIDAVFKNTAMQKVVSMAEGVSMERIPLAWEAVEITDGQMAKALVNADLLTGDGLSQVKAMTAEQKAHWSKVFRRVAPKGNDVVSVLQDGKPVYYQVNDPLILRAIGAMGATQYGGVMNLFRLAKRTLTGAVTIDPAFMMANFIRDTLSTWVVADNGAAPPFLKALKGAASAWKEDPDTMQMMMAGAGGGGFYEHNPAEVRKMLAKKMPNGKVDGFLNSVLSPSKIWRFWQKVGNASEQANRVAKYRQVIESGGTVAEAAYQARDVLNFTMSGDYEAMKWIVQTVPFLNARVQGLYRLARGGAENPVGFAMKGVMITAATMALMLRNQDNDEYEQLPEWDKDTYWHFFVNGEHFRLPKPFEVGALFATIPERAYRLGTGDEGLDLFTERMVRMVADTFAFNPIPQLVKPAIEQYANRNMFTGNPIIGLSQQGMLAEQQYDPWTSETMRAMASAMPDFAPEWLRSPKRLEAATRGYFGAIGMYALGASDSVTRRALGHPDPPKKAIQDYPVISRFWRNPEPRSSKYASELYDMLGEADALYRTMNSLRTQGRIEEMQELGTEGRGKLETRKFLRSVAGNISKINKQIRQVQYSSMKPAAKKAAIDKLNKSKIKVLGQVAMVSDLY